VVILYLNLRFGALRLHVVVILYPNCEFGSILFKLQVNGFKEIKAEISVSIHEFVIF